MKAIDLTVSALLALTLLAACNGDGDDSATPSPTATPTSVPTATPTATPIPAPDIPDWLSELIRQMESQPVANPPAYIARYEYKDQTVYFLPQRCCDVFSVLYDVSGNIIAHPDGGITGQGDGRAPDFFEERTNETIIWKDQRLNFQTVEAGHSSGIDLEAPELFKLETRTQWSEFWDRHISNLTPSPTLPTVEFDQEMVIAVVDQLQPTGGFSLEITDVQALDGGLQVLATRTEPGSGCAVTEAETQPFHIVRLPKSALQLALSVTSVVVSC